MLLKSFDQKWEAMATNEEKKHRGEGSVQSGTAPLYPRKKWGDGSEENVGEDKEVADK